jgi:mRNA interferase MazF
MKCKRGDVVLVLFPDSNLRSSQARPALVIQADQLNTGLSQVIVAMITTNLTRAGHPSRVLISIATPAGRQTGLRSDSVIVTDNLATIVDSRFDRVIGAWPDMAAVDAALRHTLAL